MDASQTQTDLASFAPLEPIVDEYRNYQRATERGSREELSVVSGSAPNRQHEAQAVTKLRSLAAWYREFADKATAPWIWEARLLYAERLEREADLIADHATVRSTATIEAAPVANDK
ncbi:MAG TPA: hypothetical protein VM782_11185 [Stellaceae bacterium]|nr:hypothetical protein [Stellaceae bacterium]